MSRASCKSASTASLSSVRNSPREVACNELIRYSKGMERLIDFILSVLGLAVYCLVMMVLCVVVNGPRLLLWALQWLHEKLSC